VRVAAEVLQVISAATNDHPYLTQVLCRRLFQDSGRLRAPDADDLSIDPDLRGFLAGDFGLLAQAGRRLVLTVYERGHVDEPVLCAELGMASAELAQRVRNLVRLGYLRKTGAQVTLGNQFLAAWLAAEPDRAELLSNRPAPVSEVAMQEALAGQQAQETGFLHGQLNAHRTRLVELEAIRARDLLQVSPQVLAEIEQHQFHIRHLLRASRERA
jgi:hypothetical protein